MPETNLLKLVDVILIINKQDPIVLGVKSNFKIVIGTKICNKYK